MLGQDDLGKGLPNVDIVFSSCQVLVGFTVAFVLGWGIRFRVIICKRRCQSGLCALFASEIDRMYAYPSQPCLQTQRISSRVLTLLAPWFSSCEDVYGRSKEISAAQKCALKLLNFLVGPIRRVGVPIGLSGISLVPETSGSKVPSGVLVQRRHAARRQHSSLNIIESLFIFDSSHSILLYFSHSLASPT